MGILCLAFWFEVGLGFHAPMQVSVYNNKKQMCNHSKTTHTPCPLSFGLNLSHMKINHWAHNNHAVKGIATKTLISKLEWHLNSTAQPTYLCPPVHQMREAIELLVCPITRHHVEFDALLKQLFFQSYNSLVNICRFSKVQISWFMGD